MNMLATWLGVITVAVGNPRILSIKFKRGPLRPDQVRDVEASEEVTIDAINAEEDSRYDRMSDSERDAYYVHPNLRTRIAKFIRGR